MPGVVGRVKRTPRFDARGTGLLHFARNDGRRGGLDCFTSFAMTGVRSVDCHASLAMTGSGGWIASLRSQWRGAGCWIASFRSQWRGAGDWIASLRSQWREEELLDCFTLFAMTGSGVAGLLHFAHNDGRGGWRPWKEGANEGEIQIFCSFRYFIF